MAETALGEKIRNYRKLRGLSQMQLELEIDMAPGGISRIESGKVNPSKETILKIIETLKVPPDEAASLFNITFVSDFEKFVEIDKSISNASSPYELARMVVNRFVEVLGVSYATFWTPNDKKDKLELIDIAIPGNARQFTEKVIGIDLLNIFFSLDQNFEHTNFLVEAFKNNESTLVYDFFDVVYPIVKSRRISSLLSKSLSMKMVLHIPLSYDNKVLGLLGLIWKKAEVNDSDLLKINLFASQISKVLYKLVNEGKYRSEN